MSKPSSTATAIRGAVRPAGSLVDQIGNTPLLDLTDIVRDRIPSKVSVFAKAEWFNPGGSVKDRAAIHMIRDLEVQGRLRPGGTILDASSGNTGIAYAMIAASRGYSLILCLPKNANQERRQLLASYGATIVTTSPLEGSDGAIREAQRLAKENPDWVYVDQYNNSSNWKAHFAGTGPEIVAQAPGRVTHFVSTVGTGGTFTGVGRYLRAVSPDVELVELQPDSPFHGLEGLKHMETAIVPSVWDPALADRRLGVPTEAAYDLVRLMSRHGVLVGPSGGAALWGAISVAQSITEGIIVTVFPDSGLRYLSDTHLWEDDA
ncbi:MAG: cysteine synthase [Deltaproteobacteria bacterium]|jgi:cysteine synthase B|nr:cysteine synthase [Deltaproteobacteria bacterium]|tara:strand:- start:2793 stop:3749 length:957 start_codon:yes stop_codon:yes gene_type:complete